MIGRTVAHYRILAKLGEGGMGIVFRAEDLILGRKAAIKFLGPQQDAEARRRFMQEARSAAALDHPGICPVYEVGENEGQPFLAMALIEGTTLRERIAGGPLPIAQAVAIAAQVADALREAHSKGIVHRDIKPGNIMITPAGRAVVMDFGLAHCAADSRLTRDGAVVGTPAYMAPEQVLGETPDHRADIWSLGAVLYEMLTGRAPFLAGHEQAVMYAILNSAPPPLLDLRPDAPPALAHVVERALARHRDDRTSSCADLGAELRGVEAESTSTGSFSASGSPGQGRWRRRAAWMAAAAVVMAGAAIGVHLLRRPAVLTIDSVAVLPFANLGGDASEEYIADGVTEALITELSQIKQLRVISRTSVMQYRDARQPLPEIARRLGVDAIVEGSALRVGGRLRITAQLIEAASDRHLWAQDYDRDFGDVLSLQKDVAREIARQVRVKLAPDEELLLAGGAAVDPEVADAFLRGYQIISSVQWSRLDEALAHFERAVVLDARFAPAHAGIGACHMFAALSGRVPSMTALPHAREAAQQALSIDETEAKAHTVLGYVSMCLDWNWEAARSEFVRALDLDPGDAVARHGYSDYLMLMGRAAESLDQIRIGMTRDPGSSLMQMVWTAHLTMAGQSEQALLEIERFGRDNPQVATWPWRSEALWQLGRRMESLAARREYLAGDDEALAALERGLAASGPQGAMAEVAAVMAARERAGRVQGRPLFYFAGAGLADSAVTCLERLADRRDMNLFHRLANPLTAPFANHPRYVALLHRMKLPEDAIQRLISR